MRQPSTSPQCKRTSLMRLVPRISLVPLVVLTLLPAGLCAQAKSPAPGTLTAGPTGPLGPAGSAADVSSTAAAFTGPVPLDYRLHLNDRVELQFPFSPEYNETIAVQPDGRIGLREVAPVQVAGKTVLEVQAAIERAYGGILKDPRVFLTLKEFLAPSFYASGEVGRPGRYELRSEITLLQAISEAGGMVNERARKKEIVIFHPQGNGTYGSRVINIKTMLAAKGTAEDPPIFPGDIVYVPQNRASKVQKFLPNAAMGAYLSPTSF